MSRGKAWLMIAFLLVVVTVGAFVASRAPQAARAESNDTPIIVTTKPLTDWWVQDGLIYWIYNCGGGSSEFRNPGYAVRQPTNSNAALTLETLTNNTCFTFRQMISDASGLYYFNGDSTPRGIDFRASGDPLTPVRVYDTENVTGIRMRISGDYIYWFDNNTQLVRVRKDGTDFAVIATGLTDPLDLVIVEARQEVYWLQAGGLWKTTLFCGTLPCAKTLQTSATPQSGLLQDVGQFGSFTLYWTELTSGGQIRAFSCGLEFCNASVPYQAPASATLTWGIGTPAISGGTLFWQETGYDSTTLSYIARVRRLVGGVPQTIAENLNTTSAATVYADQNFVYFYDTKRITGPHGIRKVALNASTIARDVAINAIEITQGVQNLANDVPLVADKPTFVRVLGKQLSGPNAFNVKALLSGQRDGVTLPGSPLQPIQALPQFQTGAAFVRDNAQQAWLFELPAAWRSGTIELRVVVDSNNAQSDPALGNNSQTQPVTFLNKAPLCVILIPVRTHTPDLLSTTIFNPVMGPTLDLAMRLMPMSEIWPFYSFNPVEEWPGGKYAPFEVGDNLGMLTAVNTRAVFTSNPKPCKAVNAGTNYVGIVAAAANVGNNVGGMAHFGLDSSWVALSASAGGVSPFTPPSGQTFAHELAHNFSRLHVDCGNPSANDLFYPYDNSVFTDGNPNSYYGFDARTKFSIAQTGVYGKVADLMSYCPPRWTSDYTWRAMLGKLKDRPQAAAAQVLPAQILEGTTVYISGVIGPDGTTGLLDSAWVFDNAVLGGEMASKWRSLNANILQATMPHLHLQSGPHQDAFHLRLLDSANHILTDQPVTPTGNDHHGSQPSGQLFGLTFPAPTGVVARIELLNGENILVAKMPGNLPPTVALLAPTGGTTVTDNLLVAWVANDGDTSDQLLTTVQYSPDLGQNWYAVINNYPVQQGVTNTVTLDPATLAGSAVNGALLRVSVSDGYNTAVATSNGFTLTDRKPIVTIFDPAPHTISAPQETLLLRGLAVDPEDGGLSAAAHTWRLGSEVLANAKEATVQGLAPGQYTAELAAQDSLAQSAVATTTFTVAPLVVPLSAAIPTLDGRCDDTIYGAATLIPLATYSTLDQANVRLVRSNETLWVCFSGLVTDTGTINSVANLWIDVDHSSESTVQAADLHIVVDENGGVGAYLGDGAGGFATTATSGVQARVDFALPTLWDAELQIDASLVGGWGHPIGLAAGHTEAGAGAENRYWPRSTQPMQPASWATTILGELPTIDNLSPMTQTVGSAAFPLTVSGQHFVTDTVVLWSGQPLTTTFVNSTTLQLAITAAQVATLQKIDVQVRNPVNLVALPVTFVVEAPKPTLVSLTPSSVKLGTELGPIMLGGSNFVTGAKVLWNGEVIPSTVINGAQISATIPDILVQKTGSASVAVVNPQPGGYASGALDFTMLPKDPPITEPPLSARIFLPLVNR